MVHEYHFERHLVEARRNVVRLRLMLGAITIAAIGIATPAVLSHAATTTTANLDGVKILNSGAGTYGGSTTGPFATATVTVKNSTTGAVLTSATNPFYFSGITGVGTGAPFQVLISPVTVGGYTVKGTTWCSDPCTGFNAQTTNFKAGSTLSLTLKSNVNYHMRWIYAPVPTQTPAPTPAPVVTPAPVLTPPPTAAPVPPRKTPTPQTHPTAPATPTVTPSSVTQSELIPTNIPTAPANFQAMVGDSNVAINLSWSAFDGVGPGGYQIDRSIDQVEWTTVAPSSTELLYSDTGVTFGVHYYYRLHAITSSGGVSAYAYTDAATGSFTANSDTSSGGSFQSDDQSVSVNVPAGALDAAAVCTVSAGPKLAVRGKTVIAGPYTLDCKSASGAPVLGFAKPVSWTYSLKSKLGKLTHPTAVVIDGNGGQTAVGTGTYNASNQTLSFGQTASTTTAVLASAGFSLPSGLLAIIVILLAVVGGVITVVLRKSQRGKYENYLRSKYYNL